MHICFAISQRPLSASVILPEAAFTFQRAITHVESICTVTVLSHIMHYTSRFDLNPLYQTVIVMSENPE